MSAGATIESVGNQADAAMPVAEIGFNFSKWQSTFRDLRPHGEVTSAFMNAVAESLTRLPNTLAATGFLRQGNRLVPATSFVCRACVESQAAALQTAIEPSIQAMCQDGQSFHSIPLSDAIDLVMAAVGPPHQPRAVLCLFAKSLTTSKAISTLAMQVASSELERWFAPSPSPQRDDPNQEKILWDACQTQDLRDACFQLATRLSELLYDQIVLIGCRRNSKRCSLEGIAGIPEFGRPSPIVTAAEELMTEAIIRGEMRGVSAAASATEKSEAEIELLDAFSASQIVSGPLRGSNDNVVGAWIVLRKVDVDEEPWDHVDSTDDSEPANHCRPSEIMGLAARHATLAGLALDTIRRLQPTGKQRLTRVVKDAEFWRKRRNVAMVATVLLASMLLPMPYRIKCKSELQPLTRRFVPAPYDGLLDQVLVEPGDFVEQGQLLARMNGRELQWQLAAARADMKRYSKEQDAAMAAGETAAAQVAELHVKSNRVRIEQLTNQLQNLEIKSPVSGMILDGDPQKMVGARLSIGQSLFETGPLDEMVIEVQIPDEEVAYASPGDPVQLQLDAYPHRKLVGVIRRINPQAELRQQENVFIAEVLLPNPNHVYRPGMAGQARVKTDWHPVGWILFHGVFDQLRFWTGL